VKRPICKKCVRVVPLNSFCWAWFSHRTSGNLKHLFWYCPDCNIRVASPIAKVHLDAAQIDATSIPEFVVSAAAESQARVKPKNPAQSDPEVRRLRTMPYAEYLLTDHWKLLRGKCLKRARNHCQLCNSAQSLNVHHRTYERRGCEFLKDLIVLCRACHAKFHDKLP